MSTIVFFVSEEDYQRCIEGPKVTFKTHEESKKPLARFIDDIREWGGMNPEDVYSVIKTKDAS